MTRLPAAQLKVLSGAPNDSKDSHLYARSDTSSRSSCLVLNWSRADRVSKASALHQRIQRARETRTGISLEVMILVRKREWVIKAVALWLPIQLVLGINPAEKKPDESGNQSPQFRVSTDLVRLSVSVTDRSGRPFTGLTKNDIRIYEDKVEQDIQYFIPDTSPLAQGLVLDSSGSMRSDFKMDRARAAALHFVETGHPEDEVFLVTFDSRVSLRTDFTTLDRDALAVALATIEAEGRTTLYDAVYMALDKLERYPKERRKVILLITDGADTGSLYSLGDVRELARESDVQIYAVGILGRDLTPYAISAVRELAEITGGLSFFPQSPQQMVNICHGIAVEIHQQYLLAYRSTNRARDGKWRKIEVKVDKREGWPDLVTRTRKGYYASPA